MQNVVTRDGSCGIKLSRNALPDDQSNPSAPGAWNVQGGFFHNENTFDNVLCIGGEIGFFGSVHTNTFSGITCQDQVIADTNLNKVLPIGSPAIGMLLQNSGNDQSSFGAGGNTVNGFYTEVCEQPLITEFVGLSLGSTYVRCLIRRRLNSWVAISNYVAAIRAAAIGLSVPLRLAMAQPSQVS